MRRGLVVLVAAMTAVGASCVPPPPPAPKLPAGVGVRWIRDTGGTVDLDTGVYTAAFDRYVTLDGVVTGPTPGGAVPDPLPPLFNVGPFLPAQRPDGTARFPNNGFAGEGITMTGGDAPFTLSFPAGSCTLASRSTRSVYPSPDGTKAAVYDLSTEADSTSIAIVSLEDGGPCPIVSFERHVRIGDDPGDSVRSPVVWSPGSDAILYTATHHDGSGGTAEQLHRLDATSGAAFAAIGSPVDGGMLVPLGWSVADRVLTLFLGGYAAPAPAKSVYTLATMPVAGGAARIIERKDLTGLYLYGSASPVLFYYGYFVPGTTTIVFNSLSRTVTNSTGQTFPWVRVRRVADAADAVSAPLTGTNPPVTWHQEALRNPDGPPFTLIDVPDVESFERFVR